MKGIALLLTLLLALTGCSRSSAEPSGQSAASVPPASVSGASSSPKATAKLEDQKEVEITERLFLGQITDVYLNAHNYLGRTIKLEGIFSFYTWEGMDRTTYMVYRMSPGCCGADGQAGFEVCWPEGSTEGYPEENDWVEATGTLEAYEENGMMFLRLSLLSLTVLEERGVEFVTQ